MKTRVISKPNQIKPESSPPDDDELELEILTSQYLDGKLSLTQYKKRSAKVEPRLDLRSIVKKLKPILVSHSSEE